MKFPVLIALIALFPVTALAQHAGMAHQPGMQHDAHEQAQAADAMAHPEQAGQGAFAAIQEIVEILMADEKTDWSKVDIEALRRHLIDMDNVTLRARVVSEPVDGGMMFVVTGEGEVRDSIARMVEAHAATMNGVGGFTYEAQATEHGATLVAKAGTPADAEKLNGLGFIGVMTLGAHHQPHHIAIARGDGPHH
ncbi:MAG: hypothetical protein AB7O39_05345 [Flavobacteriaceae bacterium]